MEGLEAAEEVGLQQTRSSPRLEKEKGGPESRDKKEHSYGFARQLRQQTNTHNKDGSNMRRL